MRNRLRAEIEALRRLAMARIPNPRLAMARVKVKRALRRAGVRVDPRADTAELVALARVTLRTRPTL